MENIISWCVGYLVFAGEEWSLRGRVTKIPSISIGCMSVFRTERNRRVGLLEIRCVENIISRRGRDKRRA